MKSLQTALLFSGICGVELGLSRAGHETKFFCEFEPGAQEVLKTRFPDIPLHSDVRNLKRLPKGTELLTAGFPCQDLSQAGETRGMRGARSGLVGEVFRLLRTHDMPNVLLENVPFMLQLEQGILNGRMASRKDLSLSFQLITKLGALLKTISLVKEEL